MHMYILMSSLAHVYTYLLNSYSSDENGTETLKHCYFTFTFFSKQSSIWTEHVQKLLLFFQPYLHSIYFTINSLTNSLRSSTYRLES